MKKHYSHITIENIVRGYLLVTSVPVIF